MDVWMSKVKKQAKNVNLFFDLMGHLIAEVFKLEWLTEICSTNNLHRFL